ncbi:MAG: hypothetical protein MJZ37_01075 [Bacilli bacterium]|nr:hypothetical protein [Bacilli bacterium]
MILIGGEQKNQAIKKDGICTCLCSSMGSGGGYIPLVVFEIRHDEGVRLWNDEVCGALRTIDACGDKYVLVKNE